MSGDNKSREKVLKKEIKDKLEKWHFQFQNNRANPNQLLRKFWKDRDLRVILICAYQLKRFLPYELKEKIQKMGWFISRRRFYYRLDFLRNYGFLEAKRIINNQNLYKKAKRFYKGWHLHNISNLHYLEFKNCEKNLEMVKKVLEQEGL